MKARLDFQLGEELVAFNFFSPGRGGQEVISVLYEKATWIYIFGHTVLRLQKRDAGLCSVLVKVFSYNQVVNSGVIQEE